MTINAILFDIGGVLVRTENRTPRAQLAARLGTTYEALANLVFSGEQGLRAAARRGQRRGAVGNDAQGAAFIPDRGSRGEAPLLRR